MCSQYDDPLEGYEFLMLEGEKEVSPMLCQRADMFIDRHASLLATAPKPQYLSTKSTPCRNEYIEIGRNDKFYLPEQKMLYYPSHTNTNEKWLDERLEACMHGFKTIIEIEELASEERNKKKKLKNKIKRDKYKERKRSKHPLQEDRPWYNELVETSTTTRFMCENDLKIKEFDHRSFRIRDFSYDQLTVIAKSCVFVLSGNQSAEFSLLPRLLSYSECNNFNGNAYILRDDFEYTCTRYYERKNQNKCIIFVSMEIDFPDLFNVYDFCIFTKNKRFTWSDIFTDILFSPLPLYDLVSYHSTLMLMDLDLPTCKHKVRMKTYDKTRYFHPFYAYVKRHVFVLLGADEFPQIPI